MINIEKMQEIKAKMEKARVEQEMYCQELQKIATAASSELEASRLNAINVIRGFFADSKKAHTIAMAEVELAGIDGKINELTPKHSKRKTGVKPSTLTFVEGQVIKTNYKGVDYFCTFKNGGFETLSKLTGQVENCANLTSAAMVASGLEAEKTSGRYFWKI